MRHAISELNFSARALRPDPLKVSRTIADLGRPGGDRRRDDVQEAIQYRTLDRQLWV
ncbi:MAG: hypothetical protein U1G05_14060 [Kiritimatiellia bacterium]